VPGAAAVASSPYRTVGTLVMCKAYVTPAESGYTCRLVLEVTRDL